VTRKSGVSPLLAFFDATGTTSSAVRSGGTSFQDVSYSWNFGDTGVSGSGTWAHGSHAGHNGKNTATGGVAAHLYITNGGDTTYPVTVTAYDGTNTASCSLGVTAYNPAGANGFPGNQTTCVYNSTPGSSCPAGAALLQTYSINTALGSAFGSGKRVLFRCGDRFSGGYTIGSSVTMASIGAYGGCENSTANRPIFQNSSGTTLTFVSGNPTDIRITDIDFEDGTRSAQVTGGGGGQGQTQITLYNLNCNGMNACYDMQEANQSGIVASVATGMNNSEGNFWNYGENNCANGSSQLNCGGTPVYRNINYNAFLGNSFDGAGATPSNTWETFRISACRLCVFANNTFKNAAPGGAVLKLHSGNTWTSQSAWIGQYAEYIEISDNLFTGTSGAQMVEISPQNSMDDERLRYIVVERNLWFGVSGATAGPGRQLLVGAVSTAIRNNVFYVSSGDSTPPEYGVQIARRGIEPVASAAEVYNNTCYTRTAIGGCIGFDGAGLAAPGINSWAENNLFYNNGGSSSAVVNRGSGNTVSGNTPNSAANPMLMNGSATFSLISDFQPTQNYSGGVDVPVWYDALGVAWGPTWYLGALKP